MFIGGNEESTGAAGCITHGLADLGINHLRDDANQMAGRSELRRLLLGAQFAGKIFEEIAFHIGVVGQKANGRDDVDGLTQGRAGRDNHRSALKDGARAGGEFRVLSKKGEFVAQVAQHPLVVGIAREQAPAQRLVVDFALADLELAEEGLIVSVSRLPLLGVHLSPIRR